MTPFVHGHTTAFTLDPAKHPVMLEYRIDGYPSLPLALAIELIAQVALKQHTSDPMHRDLTLAGIRMQSPLMAYGDDAFAIEVGNHAHHRQTWNLCCDLRNQDGVLIEPSKRYATCTFEPTPNSLSPSDPSNDSVTDRQAIEAIEQSPIEPIDENAVMFLGHLFRGSKLGQLTSIGYGSAPFAEQIPTAAAHFNVPLANSVWGEAIGGKPAITPTATIDLMLDAVQRLADRRTGEECIICGIDELQIHRHPNEGESLTTLAKWIAPNLDEIGGTAAANVYGEAGDLVVRMIGIQIEQHLGTRSIFI
ncbi:hypothetical protein LOC67_26670 [Stieleria sp. JC731]|uniref:hypothetical protein n=1 Tax=Pirellulaceae TaxID=2691357 RepID=UPI001E3FA690|nr:hypothetical protein [Stieleria sp. JC731]MCC9604153.1 hypothetical protein [Stieleria sp. JC731]